MRKPSTALKAPFLKRVSLLPEKAERNKFPFTRFADLLTDDFFMEFTHPVTIFVGENGSGKSTILQALAKLAGFAAGGGDAWFQLHYTADTTDTTLVQALRPAWLPKVSNGFFFRSDTFADVARYIDDEGNQAIHGGPLWERSHGEIFMSVFNDRFAPTKRCMYLMDEPENALSPMRQFELMRLMRDWEMSGNAQMIMATHSPILMSYPGADLRYFSGTGIEPISYDEIEHVQITRAFLNNPARVLDELFRD
ncbi:MAG: ATPase [Rhodospirillaceae bacterium]|nr:ATPase [Magnetovibrio sp.]MAY67381.1 ATPase [Rhodospirillaceae bacterium]